MGGKSESRQILIYLAYVGANFLPPPPPHLIFNSIHFALTP